MSEQTPPPERKTRKRRLHWHVGFWMLVWLGLGAIFVGLAGMSLTGRVVVLPAWVTARIEARLDAAMDPIAMQITRSEFAMSPRGTPRLRLVDLSVRDETGLEIAQVHRLESGLDLAALMQGDVAPAALTLSGAQVTIRRRANGEFDLSFGQAGGASGDLASVLDAIDGVFASGPLSQAAQVGADQLTITLEDARSGRLWQVTDGRLTLTQTDKIIDITVAFDVFNQTEELAQTTLGFRAAKGSSEASLSATFRNAAAADIAAQSPVLAFLGVLDAPISGALRTSIGADGKISELAGTLAIGAGALSPSPGARPVRFDAAKVYLDYEPEQDRVNLVDISVISELGEANGAARVYLRDYNRGWPTTMVGQVTLQAGRINPAGLFAGPVVFDGGAGDFRLRLNPFTLEIGQLALSREARTYRLRGEVSAGRDGWALALDGETDAADKAEVLALWPVTLATKARKWVADNMLAGQAIAPRAAVRLVPGEALRLSVQTGFRDASVQAVKSVAPVQGAAGYLVIEDKALTVVSEAGTIAGPDGGKVDVAGTVFSIPRMGRGPTPARVDLALAGRVGPVLRILDGDPFRVFRNSRFGPDLATGRLSAKGVLRLVLKPRLQPEEVIYDLTAELRDLRSSVLVPGRTMRAAAARLHATNAALEVSGDVRIGKARASGTWSAGIGPDVDGTSQVTAEVTLDQDFIDEFSIGLPKGAVSGSGAGQLEMEMAQGQAPSLRLVSDLAGLRIAIPDLSWSKPAGRKGSLVVEGRLGERPRIDRLELEASGLKATGGTVTLKPDGGLDEARFARVRLGGWLDAPVTFTGRGPTRTAAISVTGGRADLSRATFTGKPGGRRGGDGPVRVALDRLTISEGITLTSFSADLNTAGGLNGKFSARVNGGAAVHGVVAPQPNGSAVRITSSDAGGVMRDAGVFKTARGGDLSLVLVPRAGEGTYDGELKVTDVRVVGASALAEMLSAISVVGLLEQMEATGIAFSEVEARFRLTPSQVAVTSGSAIGASLGVSMDGTYQLGSGHMDMAGVISPVYLLNAVGQVFTRKGEGLLGFTYTMKGPPDSPKVSVNPLSLFTPGMFREIFRRPPPKLEQ